MPPKKKKVTGLIKLQIQAGAANPAPPVGPALGQHGVNIMEFCKAYNAATESQRGQIVPVEITVTPLADRGGESGGARVIVRHGPFPDDADTMLTVADSAESWRWYLCNLRSVLETKHDMRAIRPL